MSNYQSLSAAISSRVDVSQAQRLASERTNAGHGELCPAGAPPTFDVYGRPAHPHTLTTNVAAECGHYAFSAADLMGFESNHRPYLAICKPGLRKNGDWMGVGRDVTPQNLYNEGFRGNYVRHFNNASNASPDISPYPQVDPSVYDRRIQSSSLSHDATINRQWR